MEKLQVTIGSLPTRHNIEDSNFKHFILAIKNKQILGSENYIKSLYTLLSLYPIEWLSFASNKFQFCAKNYNGFSEEANIL